MSAKETTKTPLPTQRAATRADVLPLDDLSLLGTFDDGENQRALLRRSTGRVMRVTVGRRIGEETLVAIDDGSIVLANGSTSRRLHVA